MGFMNASHVIHTCSIKNFWPDEFPFLFSDVQFLFFFQPVLNFNFSFFFLFLQNIVNTVGEEIKRLLEIFLKRNPMFNGKYSVCGHSLGNSKHAPSMECFALLSTVIRDQKIYEGDINENVTKQ